MAIKLYDYDAVDFLNTEEDIENYLNEAIGDGDPAVFAKALGDVARARGMTKVARDSGVSREAIYRSFSGKGNPEFGTVVKVARAVGFDLTVRSLRGRFRIEDPGVAEYRKRPPRKSVAKAPARKSPARGSRSRARQP